MSHNIQKDFSHEAAMNANLLVDLSTKEKIRKHLSDVNDIITEDDIKNIRTDIFITPSTFSSRP